MKSIIHELKARQDFEYRSFCIRLLPTVSADTILGVRVPQIRSYARQIAGSAITREFIQVLPHTYLEENYLHGFLIEQETEFACALAQMERFLPYIDNWAVCDSVYPRALEKIAQSLRKQRCVGCKANTFSPCDTVSECYCVHF